MQQRLDKLPGPVKYVLNALVQGSIGNAGYAVLGVILFGFIALLVGFRHHITWILLILATLLLLIMAVGIFFLFRHIRQLDSDISAKDARIAELGAELSHAASTVKLDDNLLSLLSALVAAPPAECETTLKLLTGTLVRLLREVMGGIGRGTLLRREGDYLVPWIPHEMPEERLGATRFYVGNDHSRHAERGVAGIAYEARQLQTAHLRLENGVWVADHPSYISPSDPRLQPQYLSFVAIPLISPLEEGQDFDPVGVLCLDSADRTAFDAPETPDRLVVLVDRLLIAIAIHETLRRPDA